MNPSRSHCWLGVLIAGLVGAAPAVHAQASADHAAALVVYPYITVDLSSGIDTQIQLTNTANAVAKVRCFYEDLTPECVNGAAGESCAPRPETCSGFCMPHMVRKPFRVRITNRQPLAWRASAGLVELPLDGVDRVTQRGESNEFTVVPGLGEGPLVGTLRCVVVGDDPLRPTSDNILVGLATIARRVLNPTAAPPPNAMQYRAIGVRAVGEEVPNDDEFLHLGGTEAEYEACPAFQLMEHFFYGATLRVGETAADVEPSLVLTGCGANEVSPPDTVMQFLVRNEFDQRFSTSRAVRNGQLVSPLAAIDTPQLDRSIFSVQVVGTLTGQTLMNAIGGGVHAVALEAHRGRDAEGRDGAAAANVHAFGEHVGGDIVAYRGPRCDGDCNLDRRVSIDELIGGVNIALDRANVRRCPPMDGNSDFQVQVNELMSATVSALDGCPQPVAPPTPPPPPTPTRTDPVASEGPEITHLGLARADDVPLQPDSTDAEGRPVYDRPFGQGMTVLVEARPGTSGRRVGGVTYSLTGVPDLQMLVSRALGNGDAEVCEDDGARGGVPASPSLEFASDPATVDAMNDLGCRAYDRVASGPSMCTRSEGTGSPWAPINAASQIQFCVPIGRPWAFPPGLTIVAARVRDQLGNLSAPREMVVRVPEP